MASKVLEFKALTWVVRDQAKKLAEEHGATAALEVKAYNSGTLTISGENTAVTNAADAINQRWPGVFMEKAGG